MGEEVKKADGLIILIIFSALFLVLGAFCPGSKLCGEFLKLGEKNDD
jgi:hypothetical protein